MSICLLLGFASCNDIDNYEAPNGGIYGSIIDESTSEPIPLPVQGESGVMISLDEIGTGATAPITFRAKQDGTYENSKVFKGYYRITLSNCPLVGVPTKNVQVDGQTKFDIYAIPFARLSATATISDNKNVTVNYNIETTDASIALSNVKVMWNFAPGVDVNNANYATIATKDASNVGSHIFELLNDSQYLENHYKIVANKGKVYVRVAATTTSGGSSNVNYSKVIELTVN